MIKCKCGVELFKIDVVDKTIKYGGRSKWKFVTPYFNYKVVSITYRCPKCFKTIKVKIND